MPYSADFSGGYRLECKLRKTFDFIASAKSVSFYFYFVGEGCGPATTSFGCTPVPNLHLEVYLHVFCSTSRYEI